MARTVRGRGGLGGVGTGVGADDGLGDLAVADGPPVDPRHHRERHVGAGDPRELRPHADLVAEHRRRPVTYPDPGAHRGGTRKQAGRRMAEAVVSIRPIIAGVESTPGAPGTCLLSISSETSNVSSVLSPTTGGVSAARPSPGYAR